MFNTNSKCYCVSSQAMCELVKSTSPVSVLGSQLEKLSVEHRGLLKELLRLFGLVRMCMC